MGPRPSVELRGLWCCCVLLEAAEWGQDARPAAQWNATPLEVASTGIVARRFRGGFLTGGSLREQSTSASHTGAGGRVSGPRGAGMGPEF